MNGQANYISLISQINKQVLTKNENVHGKGVHGMKRVSFEQVFDLYDTKLNGKKLMEILNLDYKTWSPVQKR